MNIQQIEEYADLSNFNARFQLLYIDVYHLNDSFIVIRRYISVLKLKTRVSVKIVLYNKSNMKLDELIIMTKTFEVIYNLSSIREHNKKSNNIIAFIDENVNENLKAIKKNFKYYNCEDSSHKLFECINSYVFKHASKDWKKKQDKKTKNRRKNDNKQLSKNV